MAHAPQVVRTMSASALAIALIAHALGPLPLSAQQSVQDFYSGKQITVIVGAGTGGGYDLLARLMARHMGRHIPGNPTLIVQNMPGAGSLNATNHLFNVSPKDGSVIALIQRNMLLAPLVNPTGVRFANDRLNWIGSLNSETGMTVAWHDVPHVTAKDLFEKELIVGGITNVDPEATARLYNAVLGTKFKIVTGYNSTSVIALAIERGEVQGIADWSWSSVKLQRPHWIAEKKVKLLLQGALTKDPELPDVPSAYEFAKTPGDKKILELHFSQKLAARPVVAPPDVPADRVAALRTAFLALNKDKEFLADAERTKTEVGLISGAAVETVIKLITGAPPDIVDRYAKALAPPGQSR
jgi:tripartite-type tricarboxylate transporter receptor subunit TctC